MTTKDKIPRRKLSLLELASDLSNVSRACKVMGYSRQQFYEIRRNFQTYGAEGLVDRLPGGIGEHRHETLAVTDNLFNGLRCITSRHHASRPHCFARSAQVKTPFAQAIKPAQFA